MVKNIWTIEECDEVLESNKANTAFFGDNGGITYEDMYNMLRYRMQFGEAETNVIIASLIKAGAQITEG